MPISQSNLTTANVSQYSTVINGSSNSASSYGTIVNGSYNTIVNGSYNTITTTGTGFISSGFVSVLPINEDEVTIDIVKMTVEVFDFTKTKTKYNLKQFKTKKIENKEINCISVDRDLEPGDLRKFKESKNPSEVLLEFDCNSDYERYGEKYISKIYTFHGSGIDFPNIINVGTNTIANNLISVQPMGAPSGQLFYFDTVYGNGTSIGTGSDYVLNNTVTTDDTYTIGNIQTCNYS